MWILKDNAGCHKLCWGLFAACRSQRELQSWLWSPPSFPHNVKPAQSHVKMKTARRARWLIWSLRCRSITENRPMHAATLTPPLDGCSTQCRWCAIRSSRVSNVSFFFHLVKFHFDLCCCCCFLQVPLCFLTNRLCTKKNVATSKTFIFTKRAIISSQRSTIYEHHFMQDFMLFFCFVF